jgi:excisionase family DNA binding protein
MTEGDAMTEGEAKPKKLLSVAEAAEALEVAPQTIRRWLQKGHLPGVKMGPKVWRVPRVAVERMLEGEAAA